MYNVQPLGMLQVFTNKNSSWVSKDVILLNCVETLKYTSDNWIFVAQCHTAGIHKQAYGLHFLSVISGTVRNVQYSGFTPEPTLSVAVSVIAEAACLMKHGKV